jgi:hypothetical protein
MEWISIMGKEAIQASVLLKSKAKRYASRQSEHTYMMRQNILCPVIVAEQPCRVTSANSIVPSRAEAN